VRIRKPSCRDGFRVLFQYLRERKKSRGNGEKRTDRSEKKTGDPGTKRRGLAGRSWKEGPLSCIIKAGSIYVFQIREEEAPCIYRSN
jgi:hypothetical protein